jgi:hypothetical protein
MVLTLLAGILFLSQPPSAGSQSQTTDLNPSYLNFQAALLWIDEKGRTANVSIFISAQVDNRSAPDHLEVSVESGAGMPFFIIPFSVPVQGRNANYGFYQMFDTLNIPLGDFSAPMFPFDKYRLNFTVRVVPSFLFDSESVRQKRVNVDFLVVPTATYGWDISITNPTAIVDSDRVLVITGLTAFIARDALNITRVALPIYAVFWLVGGTMALEVTSGNRKRSRNFGNVSNRLTIFVAAFVALIPFSLTVTPSPASLSGLPSMATLLVQAGEVCTVIFAFVTFLDANTDSRLWAIALDTLGVVASVAAVLLIVRVTITNAVFSFTNLPPLAQAAVMIGLLSGVMVRYFYHIRSGQDESNLLAA